LNAPDFSLDIRSAFTQNTQTIALDFAGGRIVGILRDAGRRGAAAFHFGEDAEGGVGRPEGGQEAVLDCRPAIVAAHVADEVDVVALDVANARLARGQGRRRLRVGRVTERLLRQSGHHEFGFSSVGGYSREQLGRSAAWLYESRRVALQLAELPACEQALGRGEITWKMAALLGRQSAKRRQGDASRPELDCRQACDAGG